MTRRIAIILNPVAGRERANRHREKLERLLEETANRLSLPNSAYWSIAETSEPGEAERLAKGAASYGFEVVAAAGGDGTLSEVLNGVVGTSAKLGVIPLGTGNDFARCIGIGKDITLAIETLFLGESRLIDIGRATFAQDGNFDLASNFSETLFSGDEPQQPNPFEINEPKRVRFFDGERESGQDASEPEPETEIEEVRSPRISRKIITPLEPLLPIESSEYKHPATNRFFLNISGCGIDAEVAERVNVGYRFLSGTSAYLAALMQSLFRYRATNLTLTLDGEERQERAMFCCIANATSYGGGMRVTPDALIDDGLFDICLLKEAGRLEFLRAFPKVYAGKHKTHPKVEILQARHVIIESEPPLPVLIDGDVIGMTPVEFEIVPSAIEFLFPSLY